MVDRSGADGRDWLSVISLSSWLDESDKTYSPDNEDQQHLPPSRGLPNRSHVFSPARGNFDETQHLPPRGHGKGSPNYARPQQREPLGIPGIRAFTMLQVPQLAREPRFQRLEQILPEAGLPRPSQAPPQQPVPDASVKMAHRKVSAMLRDYLRRNRMKEHAASVIECYIDASIKEKLFEDTSKQFLVILTSQLSEEGSRSVWTNVFRAYCVHISQYDDEQLKKCLIDAVHCSRHWILEKLDGSQAFVELKKETDYTPALFTLILQAYCKRRSDDDLREEEF
ncbi:MAG: hypothetical protein Q9209_003652 [Squamulea sp. 1 TL-2023]